MRLSQDRPQALLSLLCVLELRDGAGAVGPHAGGSQPGAGSGSLSLGPSCGVIQRIPQDRKVARVSRLWWVREGS